MSKKEVKNTTISSLIYVPFIMALIVIPLIIHSQEFENGLSGYAWYSRNTTSYDFFLYWKSRFIMITGLLAALILAWKVYTAKPQNKKIELPISFWLPLCVYGVFVLCSSLFSENTEFAFWGSAEQFEGGLVLLSYVVFSIYALYFVTMYEIEEKIVLYIVCGCTVVSLIGAFQFAGFDFFRTKFAKALVTLFDSNLAGKEFSFSFDLGRTYTTLYNPNYVGSYVALLLPLVVACFIINKKTAYKLLAALCSICMILSLVGSESMTGYIALFAIALLVLILLLPYIKKYMKRFVIVGISVLVVFTVLIVIKRDAFEYGINKIFHPIKNNYAVSDFSAKKGDGVRIYTRGKVLNVKMETQGGKANFEFTDEDGNPVASTYNPDKKKVLLTAKGFEGFAFTASTMQVDSVSRFGFKVEKDWKRWSFVNIDGTYQFLSNYGKATPIRQIDTVGFEHLQHFASRRGFIWSRTIPLIGKHIFLGSGPDTFVLEFPNDDFVGMVNNGYSGNMVTKPHNMYMQIAVQTGLLSLIAFLVLYFAYFIDSIKLLWKCEYDTKHDIGLACLLGTFGYMVTGLANDSTVTVAPIFWVLLGVGAAVNSKMRKTAKQMA